MTEVKINGRAYSAPPRYIEADGKRYATGLLLPHEPDRIDRPLMLSQAADGVRDLKDVREVIENPRRATAAVRFPPKVWTRSQGQVGSCAGYAAAWALARTRVDSGHKFQALSGESVYSQTNGGRDRGSGLIDNIKALVKTGAAPEGLNVAGRFYTESTLPPKSKSERHRFRVFEWHQCRSEIETAIAIASGFIVAPAIHCGPSWSRLSGDVLIGDNGPGNHAVIIDDVRFARSGKLQFRMANSHGLRWGLDGVAWTEWDRHYSGPIRHHVFYAIRDVLADPKSTNPPELKP